MAAAFWLTVHGRGGFAIEHAALAGFDLSVLGGSWLVQRDGSEVAKGTALSIAGAKQAAEAVALKLARDDKQEMI